MPPLPSRRHRSAAPPQSTAQQQRVKTLIQQVEEAYAAGKPTTRKAIFSPPEADFDHAVDLMLTSGIDIKSTPELQDEFDRIVDQINGLEMEALSKATASLPRPRTRPPKPPSEVTFVVDPNIVAKANADLATTKSDLPLVVNDYVAAYINFFANTHQRPQHAASLLPARRPIPADDSARDERRRRAAGPHLPGRGRIRLPAARRQPQVPRRRHVAVHAPRQLRPRPQQLCR